MSNFTSSTIISTVIATTEPWINSGNPFYEKYKNYGVIWPVAPALLAILACVIIGFWCNGNIVVATWKTRSLHGTCNYLLAISAAADSIHGTSQFIQAFIFFTGINFIPLRLCVYLQTFALSGLNFGIILILLIGIDRVYSVMLPGRHRTMNSNQYMIFMMIICMGYNIILLYFTYDFALKNPKEPSGCSIVDAMPSTPGNIWFYLCVILNILTVLCYVVVWLAIKFKSGVSNSTKRVFKSLSLVTASVFFGWTINAVCRLTLTFLEVKLETFWFAGMYTGIFVNIACGLNYFILYATSNEYSYVFKSYLNYVSEKLIGRPVVIDRRVSIQPSIVSTRM
uniref:G-protein coupled receptors family 1 profile domain-containing protein n=1 Tax=Panagrolaimus davidi TaxID=227884 RepID=A0A914P849_9BILA